ncbi:MAG: carotenoid biosynthesis protein [Blastocatellia bacterium]|nr:carotenoid biosynthesis protein [Blastocatellia bacterium]
MKRIEHSPRTLLFGALVIAYVVMWAGGVGHYAIVGRPPLDAPWAASVFLALAGLLVVATAAKRDLPGLLLAASLGFLAEALGVRYGFIFSEYGYTEVLQPQLLRVPLVMLSAWMVLVAYSRQLFASLRAPRLAEAALCAGWMTAIDLVIDPLAANQLGYWRWERPGFYYGIPLHNFIGWFVVSLLIFSLLRRHREPHPVAAHVGLSIVLFFTIIALTFHLWLAGLVGLGLAIVHLSLIGGASQVRSSAVARLFSS